MKKIFFLFLLAGSTLCAQSDEDFQKFGTKVFSLVTDSMASNTVDFIQWREYHEFIDRQPLSPNQKSVMKQKVNDIYQQLYQDWTLSVKVLREDYAMEREDGATFEYLTTRNEPLEGTEHAYHMQTTMMYRHGKVQTRVNFNYDAAWLTDRQELVMISELSEDF